MLENVKDAPVKARESVGNLVSNARTFLVERAPTREACDLAVRAGRSTRRRLVVILTSIFFRGCTSGDDMALTGCSAGVSGPMGRMTETATKQWYIVHTYSGFEKKVSESLRQRVQA